MSTLLLLIYLGGCDTGKKMTDEKDEKQVIEEEEKVELKADSFFIKYKDTVHITLDAYFSTGKIWQIVNKDDEIKLIKSYESRKNGKQESVDVQHFLFSVPKPGIYHVEFVYERPFGDNKGIKKILKQTVISQ